MERLPQHIDYGARQGIMTSEVPARSWQWLTLVGILSMGVISVIAVLAVYWMIGGWTAVPLLDVSQPANFVLTSEDDKWLGTRSGMSVHITGKIDGVADVWVDNRETQRLSGKVDWRVYYDCFASTCTLNYQPVGQVAGQLVVRYQFH